MACTKTPVLWQCDYARRCQLEADVANLGPAYFEVLFRVLSRPGGPPTDLWASFWAMRVMVVPELLDLFLDALRDVDARWYPLSRVSFPDRVSRHEWESNTYYGLSFQIRDGGIYMCRHMRYGPQFGWRTGGKPARNFPLDESGGVYRRSDGRLCHRLSKSWLSETRLLDRENEHADLQESLLRACRSRLTFGGRGFTWVGHSKEQHHDGHLQYILPYLSCICSIRAHELINEAM